MTNQGRIVKLQLTDRHSTQLRGCSLRKNHIRVSQSGVHVLLATLYTEQFGDSLLWNRIIQTDWVVFFSVTAHPEMFGSLLIDPDVRVTRIIILTSC